MSGENVIYGEAMAYMSAFLAAHIYLTQNATKGKLNNKSSQRPVTLAAL